MAIYKLGEVLVVKDNYRSNGYPKPKELKSSGVPFIKTANFDNNYINECKDFLSVEKFSSLPEKGKVNKGALLVSAYGTIDVAILNLDEAQMSSGLKELVPNKSIIKKYLFYWLVINIKKMGEASSVFKQLTIKNILNTKMELPPIKEQKEIIDIIEPIEKGIDLTNNAMASLENLFANTYNSKSKTKVRLGDVSNIEIGGTPSTKNTKYWDGDIPWINSGKLTNTFIPKSADKFITKAALGKTKVSKVGGYSNVDNGTYKK